MEQENENSEFVDKKHFCMSNISIVILVIALFLSTFFYMSNQIKEINNSLQSIDNIPAFNENETKEPLQDKYTLKEHQSFLAIYKNDVLIEKLEISTVFLPEKDKQLLQEGINASSKQELLEIVSCYY